MNPELHPLFEPEILEQIAVLRQQYAQDQPSAWTRADEDAALPAADAPALACRCADALDRMVVLLEGIREEQRLLRDTVIRLVEIIGGAS